MIPLNDSVQLRWLFLVRWEWKELKRTLTLLTLVTVLVHSKVPLFILLQGASTARAWPCSYSPTDRCSRSFRSMSKVCDKYEGRSWSAVVLCCHGELNLAWWNAQGCFESCEQAIESCVPDTIECTYSNGCCSYWCGATTLWYAGNSNDLWDVKAPMHVSVRIPRR